MKTILKLLGKINIGKRLSISILLLVVLVVGINAFQSINTFSEQIKNNESKNLLDQINLVNSMLEEKLARYKDNAHIISQIPTVRQMVQGLEVETNTLYDIKVELGVGGLDLRNNDMETVYTIGSGSSLDSKESLSSELKKLVEGNGQTTFYTQNFINVQINSISAIMDYEKGILGSIIVSEPINIDFLNNLAHNTGSIVQIYKGEDLTFSNTEAKDFAKENLLSEDVISQINQSKEISNLILPKNINGQPYLVGYIPIRDYFGNSIGYLTLINSQTHIAATINKVIRDTVFNSLLFIIIAVLIIFVITKSITEPLNNIINMTQKVAAGDLTKLVSSNANDQFKLLSDNFNMMIEQLRSIIGQLIESSDYVNDLSQDLSEGSQQVATNSEEIAATSEEISGLAETQAEKMNQSSEVLQNIGDYAQNLNNRSIEVMKSVKNVHKESIHGSSAMQEVNNTINSVLDEIKNSNNEISALKDNIAKINKIIETITYINEETTLLSFNAAIEAARAGETGRGFAVVADEIKSLANQSNGSLEEINKIFKQVNVAMNKVVKSMNNSSNLVDEGENSLKNAQLVLNRIQDAVDKANYMSKDITSYTEEQVKGTQRIASIIQEANKVSQLNAEGAKETALTNHKQSSLIENLSIRAEEMYNVSENLKALVNKFKIN